MNKHILRLHVEKPGTLYSHENGDITTSLGGHAWYEVVFPDNSSLQAGFGPTEAKSEISSVPGTVSGHDGERYKGPPAFTASYEVTENQANKLVQFSENPSQFGFDTSNYNAITNSCVDFVWKALEVIGMNLFKKEGSVFPLDNIHAFMMLRNIELWNFSTPIDTRPWHDTWSRKIGAISIETNFWNIDREGTITVGRLGETMPDTISDPHGNIAGAFAFAVPQLSADMAGNFTMMSNLRPSFPTFIPSGIGIPGLSSFSSSSSFSCGRDYISAWDR